MLDAEREYLSLLDFALRRVGKRDAGIIAWEEVTAVPNGPGESGYGMCKRADVWLVYRYDRGQAFDQSVHDRVDRAADDFYHRCVDDPAMFAARGAWEEEAGMELHPFDLPHAAALFDRLPTP